MDYGRRTVDRSVYCGTWPDLLPRSRRTDYGLLLADHVQLPSLDVMHASNPLPICRVVGTSLSAIGAVPSQVVITLHSSLMTAAV